MNTGTDGRDSKGQQNDFYTVEQQQQQQQGASTPESERRERGGDGDSQDVVMEMSESFPDWSAAAAAGATTVAMRRVSFPNDKRLVTGYMEPADPWANVKATHSANELLDLYRESCGKHHVSPLDRVIDQLDGLELPVERFSRLPHLQLNDQVLTIAQCESLEEIFKRIRYKSINVSGCALDDTTATALFDMIEYYEATNELDISDNPRIETRGIQSCANMIKRCCSLLALTAHRIPILEQGAKFIGNAMVASQIHTLKLENCNLMGRPIATLCTGLAKNTVLKELWLASNALTDYDAYSLARLLKSNYYLQYLDISNNEIQDNGVQHILLALIEQSQNFKSPVTSSLPANEQGQGGQTAAVSDESFVKKPRSPVAEEDLVKDVNDNIKIEKAAKEDQWDFLTGDSNNNHNNNNINSLSDRPSATTTTTTTAAGKIGFIIEEGEATMQRTTSPLSVTAEEVSVETRRKVEDDQQVEEGMEVETEQQQPVANSSPSSSDSNSSNTTTASSAIDINCNICATDNRGESVTVSDQGSCSSSDLIDFGDSPKHSSRDEEMNSSAGAAEQVEMFKLDEEEESSSSPERSTENKLNCGGQSISLLQMPDSPASIVSQQSTDADSGCEVYPNHDGSFSTPPPSSMPKRFKLSSCSGVEDAQLQATPLKSERSLSSESLNSEASVESNDSKSSIRLMSNRFSKNGTLERQTSNSSVIGDKVPPLAAPTGLQVLFLWNNKLTRKCSLAISDMIKGTTTLEVLNVGMNKLGNDFVSAIKASLVANESISKLGLQSVQLTCAGAKTVAEVIEAKCGSPLTRVDLRDNNIQVTGLTAIHEAVRCNKGITQIDLNATQLDGAPAGARDAEKSEEANEGKDVDPSPESEERLKLVRIIRDQCLANETPPPEMLINPSGSGGVSSGKHKANTRRFTSGCKSSRKISLTCQTMVVVKPEFLIPAAPTRGTNAAQALLDPTRKSSSGRLKSPLPSPIPSPVPSPIPSPSRSRFQVSRVQESAASSSLSPVSPSPSSTSSSPTNSISRFRVTQVQEAKPTTTVVARSQAMTIPSCSSSSSGSNSNSSTIKSVTELQHQQPQHQSQSKQENIFFASTPPPMEPMHRGDTSSSNRLKNASRSERENKRLQSVSLDTISSSLDSPDLEVKRIMMLDDSSSIGSLDSCGGGPTKTTLVLSSTESIDAVLAATAAAQRHSFQMNVSDCQMSIDSSVESISERCNNLVLQEPPQPVAIMAPRKSNELSVSPNNEGAKSEKEKAAAPRTRKTSWIPANPATIDRLMSIFQNPFSRQCSPHDGQVQSESVSAVAATTTVQQPPLAATASTLIAAESSPNGTVHVNAPQRKENSLGNLFNWAASGMKREDKDKSSAERLADEPHSLTAKHSVLIPANNKSESNNNSNITGPEIIQLGASDLMRMNEMKENISPEHTITASTVQQQQRSELVRVKFKLGSTEDFDELLMAEDEELEMDGDGSPPQQGKGNSGSPGLTSDDSCLSLDVENGIGQIARDSMLMFNTSGGSSGSGGAAVKASSPVTSKAE